MDDEQLRALIREAVARHLGARPHAAVGPAVSTLVRHGSGCEPQPPSVEPRPFAGGHPSHYQYLALVNVGEACVIEPDVTCNHCGYCRSHGY
ncbi:MAG TPA: hypothetical protein VIX35_10935 [Vicinamibacterales bacterium]